MSDIIHTNESGAKSSKEPDLTLLPLEGLLKATERFQMGIPKYGLDNWRKGLSNRDYLRERLGHAILHAFKLRDLLRKQSLFELREGPEPELRDLDDHVGAILWFGMFASCHDSIIHFDNLREDLTRHMKVMAECAHEETNRK